MRTVRRERAAWKLVVIGIAAVVGVGLGITGARAPALSPSVRIGSAAQAPSAAQPGEPPAAQAPSESGPNTSALAPSQGTPGVIPPSPPKGTGPLLSDMWYASRAYQVFPGTPSVGANRALTGFKLSFRALSPTIEEVTVADLQDGTTQMVRFDSTERLYFIETRMGDDGVDGETNLSDDGFVFTDGQGHIISQ